MAKKLNKFERFYANNRFVINICVLLAMFFVHCFWGNMMFVAFPILLLMVLFDNIRNGFSYVVFSIPFCMMNLYWSAILFAACVCVYMIKFYVILYFKEKTKPNWLLIAFVALFFIYASLPFGGYNANWGVRMAGFFAMFAFIGMVIKKPQVARLGFNFRLLAFALLLSCVYSATFYISPYMNEAMVLSFAGGRGRFQSLLGHPNVLAMFCDFAIVALAYMILSKKNKWFDWLLMIGLTVAGFFTLSKTFLLLMILVYLVIIIWLFTQNFLRTFIWGSIAVTALIVLGVVYQNIVAIIVNRFVGTFSECHTFADFMNMVTTYRYDLWVEYATHLAHNPLVLVFGAGMGAPVLSTLSAHNLFITGTYQLGLVGMAILAVAIILMIHEYHKNAEEKTTWAIRLPIAVVFALSLVEDLIFYIV
ncbi:MAG: hypothetical protein IJ542_01775 [Clostridia bacterium]|nr:hypothetical protein [Clostridia bacterium]